MKVGDCVTVHSLPDWVSTSPQESRQVFEYCLGRTYLISSIEDDLYVLDVSVDIDEIFGGLYNDIRLEAEYLTLATCP